MSDVKSGGPPGDTVSYTVTVAGQKFDSGAGGAKGAVSLVVEDHVDMIAIAQVTVGFVDSGSWKSFAQGADMEVTMGGDKKVLFKGHVTELRYSYAKSKREVTVVGMDPQVKLMASRTTKVYEKMTDSGIVSDVIKRGGVTAGTVDATSAKSDYVFQRNEPDLYFIKRLASRNNYLVTSSEGKVHFQSVQFSGSPIEIGRDEIIRLEWGVSTMNLPPTVTVLGWDYVKKEQVKGTASSGDVTTIGGGKNGAADTGQIWKATSFISDVLVSSNTGAQEMAKAEYNRLARGFLRGTAVVHGNSKIRAGMRVKFHGHTEAFNAEGYVVSSRHTVDEQGHITEFQFVGNTKPA
jgi:phage protein D